MSLITTSVILTRFLASRLSRVQCAAVQFFLSSGRLRGQLGSEVTALLALSKWAKAKIFHEPHSAPL